MLRAIDLSTTMGAVNGRTAPAARLLMQLSVSSCHCAVVVRPAVAQQQSPARGDVGEYDYIIAGTGTPSCVLVNRLSADLGIRLGASRRTRHYMFSSEDKVSEESLAIAMRIHDLLNRHGVGKRQHAAEIQRILGLSYSQAHRKMKGANPWTIAQVKAVAQAYGESAAMLLDGLDSSEPVSAIAAKMQEAVLYIGDAAYRCLADIGERAHDVSGLEFVALKDGNRWKVFPVEAAPGGDYFVVEQILIRPRSAPEVSPVIAILDDDALLTAEMCSYFHSRGYVAQPYNTEATFRAALRENVFDGFIVDWLLESGTAEQTIQSIRQSRYGDAPILLLTGKLVTGEANEDDVARVIQQYDVKPFEKPARLNWVAVELARRLKAGAPG